MRAITTLLSTSVLKTRVRCRHRSLRGSSSRPPTVVPDVG
jgi:hypothetical protein